MSRIAVFVATTAGPVGVERITRERAPQSMVCLKRTSTVLPISAGYDSFVRPGSGVIERTFGPFESGAFRLDVAAPIDTGDSWQLGFFVAHALCGAQRTALATEESADTIIWLTGRVDHDLEVGSVGHLTEKVHASREAMSRWVSAGKRVVMCVRAGSDHDAATAAGVPVGVSLIAVHSATDALGALNHPLPATVALQLHALPVPRQGAVRPVPARLVAAVAAFAIAGVALARLVASPEVPSFPQLADRKTPPAPMASSVAVSPPPTTKVAERQITVQVVPAAIHAASAVPAVTTVTRQPATLAGKGPAQLAIFERRAPAGRTCAQVQFDAVPAVKVPITGAEHALADDSAHDLCGLAVAVDNGSEAKFVTVKLDVVSGKLLYGTVRPDYFSGQISFAGQREWAIDLPRHLAEPFEIHATAISGTEVIPEESGHSGSYETVAQETARPDYKISMLHYRLTP